MNIVIPLAVLKKFDSAQFYYPQPLIEVFGKPLISYMIKNIHQIKGDNNIVFIVDDNDCKEFELDSVLKISCPQSKIVKLKEIPKGSVCSVLLAMDKIDKKKETIILNADQYYDFDLDKKIKKISNSNCDAAVLTFEAVHPRWSFVLNDESNNILQICEKKPISNQAVAGLYYFKSFELFMKAAFNSIELEDFLNNNIYTSSVINQIILMNKSVLSFAIEKEKYFSFYTPKKINEFENKLSSDEKI